MRKAQIYSEKQFKKTENDSELGGRSRLSIGGGGGIYHPRGGV